MPQYIPSDFLGVLQLLKEKLKNKVQAKRSFFLLNITSIIDCLLQLLQHKRFLLQQYIRTHIWCTNNLIDCITSHNQELAFCQLVIKAMITMIINRYCTIVENCIIHISVSMAWTLLLPALSPLHVPIWSHCTLWPGVPANTALHLMVNNHECRKPLVDWTRPPGHPRRTWLNLVQENANAISSSTRSEVMKRHNSPSSLCDGDDDVCLLGVTTSSDLSLQKHISTCLRDMFSLVSPESDVHSILTIESAKT